MWASDGSFASAGMNEAAQIQSRIEILKKKFMNSLSISGSLMLAGVELNHVFDAAPANFTEIVSARKHYAIHLRSVVTFRFVIGAFEGSYLAPVLFFLKHLLFRAKVFEEQRFHFALGPVLLSNGSSPFLIRARRLFILFLPPGRRQGSSSFHQITPLQFQRIQQGSYVYFPRLYSAARRRRRICYRRGVVLVRERGEVVSKLVHEHVVGESIVGSHGAVKIEDAAAAISAIVCEYLDELIRRKLRDAAELMVVERQNISLRTECIVSRTNRRVTIDPRRRTRDPTLQRWRAEGPDIEIV